MLLYSKICWTDLDKLLKHLRQALSATNISETLKIHVLTKHNKDCLKHLSGNALGTWSEQASEAVHTKFLDYLARYKINSILHDNYSSQLRSVVTGFSADHL